MLKVARESSLDPVRFNEITPQDINDNVASFVDGVRDVPEAGFILDLDNQVIFKGSGEEGQLGRDAEVLPDLLPGFEGVDQAVAAFNQFDDGDFADIELVG